MHDSQPFSLSSFAQAVLTGFLLGYLVGLIVMPILLGGLSDENVYIVFPLGVGFVNLFYNGSPETIPPLFSQLIGFFGGAGWYALGGALIGYLYDKYHSWRGFSYFALVHIVLVVFNFLLLFRL